LAIVDAEPVRFILAVTGIYRELEASWPVVPSPAASTGSVRLPNTDVALRGARCTGTKPSSGST